MSGRKRKSQWDCKEETEVPSEFSKHSAQHGREIHSSHPAKLSDLNSNNCPPWSYSETWQDNNDHGDFNEIPESTRTIRGAKGYSISTCFSGRGRQNHSPSQETSWSQVHRYQRSRSSSQSRGRAGSRSRSRDRDRDMNVDRDYSRSRVRARDMDENRGYRGSRDRDRDMNEDRDYPRGRGRDMYDNRDYLGSSLMDRDLDGNRDYPGSRLRDRDVDKDRDYMRGRGRDRDTDKDSTRTRSIPFDNRRVDDGLGDRKSGSRVSSQLCRDFAVGSCRRGSQCRFLHEDDLTLRDGGEPARERAERWRDRQEASEASSGDIEGLRYHPADKVSNYNRSSRSTSFDHDRRRQPHKNGNIPCKYFAMGRCNRDDCRFSHDNPEGGSVKGRLRYDRYPQHLDNENKYWNGPERGDRNGLSAANITIWRDSDVRTMNYTDRTTAKKQNYDIFDQNLNKETKSWNGPKWGDVTVVSDVASSGWVDSNAGSVDFSEPAFGEKKTDESHGNNLDNVMWNTTPNGSSIRNIETFVPTGGASSFGREAWNNAQGSHYEAVDGSMSSQTYEQIIEGEPTQQLINNVGHPVVSESFNDQSDSRRGNNDMLTEDSNALNGVSISGTTMQLDVPDRSSGQKSDSLGSLPFSFADTAQRNMIPLNPTNGHGIDLNGSDKQSLYLNPQNEPATFSEEPTKKQVFESEEAHADCGIHQNDMSSYQITEITDLSASLNEILSKGQQLPELYAALTPNSNSSSLLTSLSNSAVVSPPVASTEAQPNPTTMFEEQHVRIADTVEPSKYDKRDNLYELGKADPLASVLSFSTVEPSKHVSDGKPYKLDKSAQSEYLLPLSNDGISEHGNNNKPYELQEPKLLHNILSSSTSDSGKDPKNSSPEKACQESPATKQLKPITNSESQQNISIKSEKSKVEEEIPSASANPEGGVREGNGVKDEKEMRVFKVALVEYVKEILKPTWKEGQMSREVHKTIVKKVVDKVSSTIQAAHVPKTQEKIDQYLAHSKSKLTKLVQAYTERLSKTLEELKEVG